MKITKKLLQDLIKEELNLLEGFQPKHFGRHRDKYVPTEIFIYSPNSVFDYAMQDDWDQPFHEGRTHYFDLTDKGQFKDFINFLNSKVGGNLFMHAGVESIHNNHIILPDDPNETFTMHHRDNLSNDELKALDGQKLGDLLFTEHFRSILPVNKEELINAGYELHGVDLTSTLEPIKM